MDLYPLRDQWWSRPGWSEWRDWRNGGPNHDGLDMYTKPGTPIYATGDGIVTRKGFHEPRPGEGHGHYVAIQYGNVEVSCSHMLHASPYAIGARVDERTRFGQVGDSGSARGYDWVFGSPAGTPLQHVHVEVRIFGTLINPRIYFDSLALADVGPVTPIVPVPEVEQMKVYKRNEFGDEWMLVWPSLAGTSTEERGYVVTTNAATSSQWERAFGKAEEINRNTYIGAQREARALHSAYRRGIVLAVPAASAADGSFTTADRQRLQAVPTAEQNGAAARSAIVK